MLGKFKQFFWHWRGILISTPTVAGLVILVRLTGLLQSWEWAAFDFYMRWRPLEEPDDRIAIVGINEADVRNLQQADISDGDYAKLLTKLKAMQPRAIGFDIYRNIPVEPGHQELVTVFESTPNIIGIQKVVGDREWDIIAPPPALQAKGQVAANDLIEDADNKVRRGLLSVKDQQGNDSPGFGLYLAALYLEQEGITLQIAPETENWWQLGDVVFVPFNANDGGYIRSDDRGYQILLNYRGPSRYFETVSMTDILQDKVSLEWGRDRVILIGKVGESFNDFFSTPYTSNLVESLSPMAGVEVHANIVSEIISATLDKRPLIQTWSDPLEWLWIVLWSGVGATLSWQLRSTERVKILSFKWATGSILAVTVLLGSTYWLFLEGWWLPVVPPLLALGGSAVAIAIIIARSAGKIRKTFGRYLSDEIVATLLENPEGLKLGGQRQKITILTSDLRGFTSATERMNAEEVIDILNHYLGYMAEVITHYQGTIDEFMGDGILVFFGAPTQREDDAQRAVACAVAMQLAIEEVNKTVQARGLPLLQMGIGINTGEVVVGNIGSEKRTKYGVVGRQVNLTYRIEGYTTGGQIFISESTLKEVGSIVKIAGQQQITPKGVQHPITIYDVEGIGGEYNLFLKKHKSVFVRLTETIPIKYAILEGKYISHTYSRGHLVELATDEARVYTDGGQQQWVPSEFSNIKINLLIENDPLGINDDIYAKVVKKTEEPGGFYICFTSRPPVVAAWLSHLYNSLPKP